MMDINLKNTTSPWNNLSPAFATYDSIPLNTQPKNMTLPTEPTSAIDNNACRLLHSQQLASPHYAALSGMIFTMTMYDSSRNSTQTSS